MERPGNCHRRPDVIASPFYGTWYLGLNYGMLFTALGNGRHHRPHAGRAFDVAGDYPYAFYAAAVLGLLAFISLFFARQGRPGV